MSYIARFENIWKNNVFIIVAWFTNYVVCSKFGADKELLLSAARRAFFYANPFSVHWVNGDIFSERTIRAVAQVFGSTAS